MLIPLSREKFEELVPLSATGAQYRYIWGGFSACLQRLLVSFAAVIGAVIVGYFLGKTFGPSFQLIAGIIAGCYWLWGPIFLASKRNWDYRQYKYSGFWRGEVLDKFVTDELVSTGENVNKRGELVVKENREKRLNLEIGDDTGFITQVTVPLIREHQSICRGDAVEMVVVSSRPDLGRFAKISDVYVVDSTVWVSDYPYVQRDAFRDVSQTLQRRGWENSGQGRSRYENVPYENASYNESLDESDRYSPNRPSRGYADERYSPDRPSRRGYPEERYSDKRYSDKKYNARSSEDHDRRRPKQRPDRQGRRSPSSDDNAWENEWNERDRSQSPRDNWEQYPQDRRRIRRNRSDRRP